MVSISLRRRHLGSVLTRTFKVKRCKNIDHWFRVAQTKLVLERVENMRSDSRLRGWRNQNIVLFKAFSHFHETNTFESPLTPYFLSCWFHRWDLHYLSLFYVSTIQPFRDLLCCSLWRKGATNIDKWLIANISVLENVWLIQIAIPPPKKG